MAYLRKILMMITIALAGCMASCTHNDGDIGPLFGQWKVEEISVDGVARQNEVQGALFVAFQSQVVNINWAQAPHYNTQYMGVWQRSGDVLTFFFNSTETQQPENLPFLEIGDGGNVFILKEITGSRMVLLRMTPSGLTVELRLTKWG